MFFPLTLYLLPDIVKVCSYFFCYRLNIRIYHWYVTIFPRDKSLNDPSIRQNPQKGLYYQKY